MVKKCSWPNIIVVIVVLAAHFLICNSIFAAQYADEPPSYYLIYEDEKWGILDQDGKVLVKPMYDSLVDQTQDYIKAVNCIGDDVMTMVCNVGMLDRSGHVVVDLKYQEVIYSLMSNKNTFIFKTQDEKWGIIDNKGNILVPAKFEHISLFFEGLAAVKIDGKFGYINEKGQIAIKPQYDYAEWFSEGLAAVVINDKAGFIDKTGRMIIDPLFKSYGPNGSERLLFKDGTCLVSLLDQNDFQMIDKTGKVLHKMVWTFDKNGIAKIEMNDKIGLVNRKGNIILKPEYDDVVSYSVNSAVIVENDSYGIVSFNGDIQLDPIFEFISVFSDSLAFYAINDKCGYVNTMGQIITEADFDQCNVFNHGVAEVLINNSHSLINSIGSIIQTNYDFVSILGEGLISIKTEENIIIIDTNGKIISFPNFDWISKFHDGVALYMVDWHFGLVDKEGNVITEPVYDWISEFHNGTAKVITKWKYGLFNVSGKEIVHPSFDWIGIQGQFKCNYPNISESDMLNLEEGVSLDGFYKDWDCFIMRRFFERDFSLRSPGLARLLSLYANHAETAGKWVAAYDAFNKAIEFLAPYNSSWEFLTEYFPELISIYNHAAWHFTQIGQYEKAFTILQDTLTKNMIHSGERSPLTCDSYNYLTMYYSYIGDYWNAYEFSEKGISYCKYYDKNEKAIRLSDIAFTQAMINEVEPAIEMTKSLIESLESSQEDKDFLLLAILYYRLGKIYFIDDRFENSIDAFDKSINLLKMVNNKSGKLHSIIIELKNLISQAYISLGDFQKADNELQQVLRYAKESGDSMYIAMTHYTMGLMHYESNELDEALACFDRYVDYNCGNDFDATLCMFYDRSVSALHYIGMIKIRNNDLVGAIKAFNQAFEILQNVRGRITKDRSQINVSTDFYQLFIDGISAYVKLYDIRKDNNILEQAFEFAEKAIAASFKRKLGLKEAFLISGLPEEEREELLQLQQAVNIIEKSFQESNIMAIQSTPNKRYDDLRKAKEKLKEHEKELSIKYPQYNDLMNSDFASIQEIRDVVIDNDEAILEYILGKDISYLFIITKTDISIKILPSRKAIAAAIDNFIRINQLNPLKNGQIASDAGLYKTLIEPVEDQMEGIRRLMIIPTEEIHFLPFEMLMNNGKYLIESFSIRYAPSANIAYLIANREKATSSWETKWRGFGDPLYQKECDDRIKEQELRLSTNLKIRSYESSITERSSLSHEVKPVWCRIPATADEVKSILDLFDSDRGDDTLFIGTHASEENFKHYATKGQRFLHIATHGTLGINEIRQPALVFSLYGNEDSGEDGFLTMSEVFGMKIPSEMVVLSACKTGLGDMKSGEGVAAMSRAFLYSGANSVVVSLWDVADQETSKFMQIFYQKILSGNEPDEALVQTKREMINTGQLPNYWAPFIYIGN